MSLPRDASQGKILVYGYGNPGREDDGLGPLMIENLEKGQDAWGLKAELRSSYQLNIEDALLISEMDMVIFVDAAKEGKEPFSFEEVDPASRLDFFTHGLTAGEVVALSLHLYKKHPKTYLMGIKGYGWGMGEGLTDMARGNLREALSFLRESLLSSAFSIPAG